MQHQKALLLLPVIAAISIYYLWILMLQNGTIDAMERAVQQQRFADGTRLRTVYLGLAPIDHVLSTLVAFTYYATVGNDQASRLLYIDVLSTLQTGQLWCLIESLRPGRTSIIFAMPAVWGLMWNGLGGGLILPLYAFFQLRIGPQQQALLPGDAKTLIPALLIATYLPSMLAVAPPLIARDPHDHQIIIGCFQVTSLALVMLHNGFSRLVKPSRSGKPPSDLPWIRSALAFAFVVSSMGHIYVVASSFFSSGIHRSVYFGISNAQVLAADVDKVALGAAFFLQWDIYLMNVTTMIWGAFLVRQTADVSIVGLTLGLAVMHAVLGPGATMSFVFYWRESRIRNEVGRQPEKTVAAATEVDQ